MRLKWIVPALLIILLPLRAHAGWEIVERTVSYTYHGGGRFEKTASFEERSQMEKGRMRSEEVDRKGILGWTVYDTNSDRILIVRTGKRLYYEGSLKAWLDDMKKMAEAMNAMKASMKLPETKVKKVGPGAKIVGYPTVRYRVYSGGDLKREVWITPVEKLPSDLRRMHLEGVRIMSATGVISKDELKLAKAGLEMKTKEFIGMEHPMHETTVLSIRKKKLSDSLFRAPRGFRRVNSIEELGDDSEEGPMPGTAFTPPAAVPSGDEEKTKDVEKPSTSEEENPAVDEMKKKASDVLKGLGGLFGK